MSDQNTAQDPTRRSWRHKTDQGDVQFTEYDSGRIHARVAPGTDFSPDDLCALCAKAFGAHRLVNGAHRDPTGALEVTLHSEVEHRTFPPTRRSPRAKTITIIHYTDGGALASAPFADFTKGQLSRHLYKYGTRRFAPVAVDGAWQIKINPPKHVTLTPPSQHQDDTVEPAEIESAAA
jgi:hypothetical protein